MESDHDEWFVKILIPASLSMSIDGTFSCQRVKNIYARHHNSLSRLFFIKQEKNSAREGKNVRVQNVSKPFIQELFSPPSLLHTSPSIHESVII